VSTLLFPNDCRGFEESLQSCDKVVYTLCDEASGNTEDHIMAAHAIPDEMRRKIILSVRVTESEVAQLRNEAESKGLAVPDYLRDRLLRG